MSGRMNYRNAASRSQLNADRASARAERMSKPRKLRARFASTCPRCAAPIAPGDQLERNWPASGYRHLVCPTPSEAAR